MASSRLYFNEQLKNKRYETIRPDAPPNYLANRETSSLKVENQESVSDASSMVVTNEANKVENEGEKPPPLAGVNVMNVILVAAECAPWSKTGNLTSFLWWRISYPLNFDILFFLNEILLGSPMTNPDRHH